MNQYSTIIIFLLIAFIWTGCNTKTDTHDNNNESEIKNNSPELIIEEKDKIAEEDFVEDERNEQEIALEHHVKYLKETWKDAPNPMVVTFDGTDMGDYFHFGFVDTEKRYYDFADGNNDLGDFKLIVDRIEANEKYVGKKFEIKWDWKMSKFPCCDGMMNIVEIEVPSIVDIKLVE